MRFDFLRARLARLEISTFGVYFAEFMAELSHTTQPNLVNLFARLAEADQHSCLEITDAALRDDVQSLQTVSRIGAAGETLPKTPLVLYGNKLYLQRYYLYEVEIARLLVAFNQPLPWSKTTIPLFERLFVPAEMSETETPIDWQKIAAFHCLSRQLSIITGGPGTGKTSTIVKILQLLLTESPQAHIKLAAPTGKAAMRLAESITAALTSRPDTLQIPSEVSTIHRLLGMYADGYSFKYHRRNLLRLDVLILDEASMIDLIMFHRLLSALPAHCRLILVGDPDQLPSIETGAVFHDLCQLGPAYDTVYAQQLETLWPGMGQYLPKSRPHQLQNVIVQLKRSYRFNDAIGIGALSYQIRNQQTISLENNAQVTLHPEYSAASVIAHLLENYQNYLTALKQQATSKTLLALFEQFRALVPMQLGTLGVKQLNRLLEETINPGGATFYHGKPLMIQRNDYSQGLFNGDVGICVQQQNGKFLVAFAEKSNQINATNPANVRCFLPERLPDWTCCFVMTVHKSQGSEFDTVSLILPQDTWASDQISNELIYTGITRARHRVHIFSHPEVLHQAVNRLQARNTGLTDMLL